MDHCIHYGLLPLRNVAVERRSQNFNLCTNNEKKVLVSTMCELHATGLGYPVPKFLQVFTDRAECLLIVVHSLLNAPLKVPMFCPLLLLYETLYVL